MKKNCIIVLALVCTYSANIAAEMAPSLLQGLGLREAPVASRDLPGWRIPNRILIQDYFGEDL